MTRSLLVELLDELKGAPMPDGRALFEVICPDCGHEMRWHGEGDCWFGRNEGEPCDCVLRGYLRRGP
jgi:hypothetical protein